MLNSTSNYFAILTCWMTVVQVRAGSWMTAPLHLFRPKDWLSGADRWLRSCLFLGDIGAPPALVMGGGRRHVQACHCRIWNSWQFHPTRHFYGAVCLTPKGARGEGGYLTNSEGANASMERYCPHLQKRALPAGDVVRAVLTRKSAKVAVWRRTEDHIHLHLNRPGARKKHAGLARAGSLVRAHRLPGTDKKNRSRFLRPCTTTWAASPPTMGQVLAPTRRRTGPAWRPGCWNGGGFWGGAPVGGKGGLAVPRARR